MTRDEEKGEKMTRFDLTILSVLYENEIDTASKALSIGQILSLIPIRHRKSYSTTYRHLNSITQQNYVKYGLIDGLASTYFISESGKSFCKAQV